MENARTIDMFVLIGIGVAIILGITFLERRRKESSDIRIEMCTEDSPVFTSFQDGTSPSPCYWLDNDGSITWLEPGRYCRCTDTPYAEE